MKFVEKLKALLPFFIYSNGVVSLATAVLGYGICIQNNIPNALEYCFFLFFSTLLTYNTQRFLKAEQASYAITKHMVWVNKHRTFLLFMLIISAIASGVSFLFLYNGNWLSFGLLSLSALISLFYIKNIGNFNLRGVPQLKIHLIALIWVVATAYFPLFNENKLEFNSILYGSIHYLYIIAITIPFDIRDLKYDDPKYKTIPQILGFNKAKQLSLFLMVLYFILSLYLKPVLQTNLYFYLALAYTIVLLMLVNEKRNDFYYSGWLEASIIVVGVSISFY